MNSENQLSIICRLPKAESLHELCDLAYEITGNPVFVSDMAHTILAYTRCVEVPDPNWQTTIVDAELSRNTLAQDRQVGIVHTNSTVEQKPVLVEDGYVPYPSLIRTLVDQGNPIGTVVVTSYLHPFEEGDAELVELISAFMLPMLKKEQYIAASNSKSAENFLIQLLEGKKLNRERVERRLRVLDFERRPYMYLLSVCLRDRSKGVGTVEQLVAHFLRLNCCQTFMFNSTLICIYGADREICNWETQEPRLHQLMQEEGLLAGVSRNIVAFEDLREYYQQARDVMEVGLRLGEERGIWFRYDSLSSYLLLQHLPEEVLLQFCHQKIRMLGEYDAAHNMELCTTLQTYLEQEKSLARASERLFIHRNTVHYRINKCMELMNTTLEDGNENFSYILSLRILEYMRKFTKKAE